MYTDAHPSRLADGACGTSLRVAELLRGGLGRDAPLDLGWKEVCAHGGSGDGAR